MKHALVIGGTGMLSKVTLWFVKEGYHVSVIGRNPKRMEQLISDAKDESLVTPLLVDYRLDDELKNQIKMAIKKNGEIDIVVAWIHSVGKNVLNIISEEISRSNHYWKLFHILGSSSNLEDVRKKINLSVNCLYRQVQLGFIIEGTTSRWLTHEEISKGIIDSIKNDKVTNLIGVLEPWHMRPK
jgi:NAD(P)-dependent dehydrogenase (short-subunit alcohol dehydrogenase family)